MYGVKRMMLVTVVEGIPKEIEKTVTHRTGGETREKKLSQLNKIL